MATPTRPLTARIVRTLRRMGKEARGLALVALAAFGMLAASIASAHAARTVRIGILMAGDNRQLPVQGFQAAMAEHAATGDATLIFDIKNAAGANDQLARLAGELVSGRPDIAIAAGGVEADALKAATAGSKLPVVFLGVSSAVERGLIDSMALPGGNLTGVDTNDSLLTEKRLWYITKILPQARKVVCFNVPTNTPSAQSTAIARRIAPQLGLSLGVIDVATKEDVSRAAAALAKKDADVILLLPVAMIDQLLKGVLLPLSVQQGIPIMGYNQWTVEQGAFAAYGASRLETGKQAARLAIKILHGSDPAVLPTEVPQRLELTVNRRMAERLGLKLSDRIWRLADVVADINP